MDDFTIGLKSFKIHKDEVFQNTSISSSLKVPSYKSSPPVFSGGQLYWNSTDKCLYYSVGNSWVSVCDASKITGNLCVDDVKANTANILGDVYIGGNLFVAGNTNININLVDLVLLGNLTVNGKTILEETCIANLVVSNDVHIIGNLIVDGNTNIGNVNFTDLVLAGNLTVLGETTLGNLCVTGNVVCDLNLDSNLTVTGKTTLDETCIANLVVSNDVHILGNLIVNGNTNIGNVNFTDLVLAGNLTVLGETTLGNLCVTGNVVCDLNLDSNLTVNGKTTLEETCIANLVVSNDVHILGNLIVNGNTNIGNVNFTDLVLTGNLTVLGETTLGNLCVTGNVICDLNLDSNLTVNGKTTLEETCIANLVVSNDVYIGGNLFVAGNTNIGNMNFTDLVLTGNLTVNGKTTLDETCIANLVVSNDVYIGGNLFVAGNTNIGNMNFTDLVLTGNLTVNGKTTLEETCIANLVVSNDVYIGGNLIVAGNTNIGNINFTDLVLTGNLTVNGKTTLDETCIANLVVSNDVYIGGDLFVAGNTNIGNVNFTDLVLTGNLTVNGKTTLDEVCISNLVVSNDVYIGGDLIVSGNTNIANVNFTDLVLTGNLTVNGKSTLDELCANNTVISGNLTVNGQLMVESCPYTNLANVKETSFPGFRIIHADPVCFSDTDQHTLIKMPFKIPRDRGAITAMVSVYQKGEGVDKFKTKSVSFNDYCVKVRGTGPELLGGEKIICDPDCFVANDTFQLVANSLDSTINLNIQAENAIEREWRADMKVCGTNLKNIPLSTDFGLESNVVFTTLGSTVYSLLDGVTSNAFSISCWINTRTLTGNVDVLSTVISGNGTRVSLDSSRIVSLEFLDTNVLQFGRISGTALSLNTWEHLAITYTGSQTGVGANIYINAVNVDSTATSTGTPVNSTTVPPRVGTSPSGTRVFSGLIDEFVIYNYALSSGQVTTIYNSGVSTIDLNSTVVSPPVPVNYYRMGDGDSTGTIIDYGTNARNGINSSVVYSQNVPPQTF